MRLPPKSPNCNAHLEHFFRSLKDETLSRLILFGEAALFNAIEEFLAHYHRERAHQGMGHRRPRETTRSADGGADQLSLCGRMRDSAWIGAGWAGCSARERDLCFRVTSFSPERDTP